MESINTSPAVYRKIILQHGAGFDNDGYHYYSQDGDGMSSFFSNLIKYAIPVIGKTIKGAVGIAKPHLRKAGEELVAAGAKRIASQLGAKKKTKKPRITGKRRI